MADPTGPGVGTVYGANSTSAAAREEILKRGQMAGQIVGTATVDPLIYMGSSYHALAAETGADIAEINSTVAANKAKARAFRTLSQAQAQYYLLTQSELADVVKYGSLYYGQDISSNGSMIKSFYETGLQAAVAQSTITGKDTTPWDAMKTLSKSVQPKDPKDEPYTGPVTNVDLTSPDNARYVLDQALKAQIGRAPTAQEQQKFYDALLQHDRMNATVTTPDPNNPQAGNVTTGGSNPTQFANEWAAGQEGAAEYKASGFTDLLMQAINNPEL